MKTIIMAAATALLYIAANSQDIITNKEPLVSADAGRILYRGFDNVVTISAGNYDSAKVEIRNGRIMSAHGSTYVIVPRPDTTATMIYIKTPGKTYEFVFQLKNIPDPTLYIPGANYNEGALMHFGKSKGITAVLEDFYYKATFKVESFWISFSGEGFDSTIVHINEGPAWDKITTELLNKCRAGTFVVIENAIVRGPDGRRRSLTDKITCSIK